MIYASLVPSPAEIKQINLVNFSGNIYISKIMVLNYICTFSILLRWRAYLSWARNCINLMLELWDNSVILLILGKNLRSNAKINDHYKYIDYLNTIRYTYIVQKSILITWTSFVRLLLCCNHPACLPQLNLIFLYSLPRHFLLMWFQLSANHQDSPSIPTSNKPNDLKTLNWTWA